MNGIDLIAPKVSNLKSSNQLASTTSNNGTFQAVLVGASEPIQANVNLQPPRTTEISEQTLDEAINGNLVNEDIDVVLPVEDVLSEISILLDVDDLEDSKNDEEEPEQNVIFENFLQLNYENSLILFSPSNSVDLNQELEGIKEQVQQLQIRFDELIKQIRQGELSSKLTVETMQLLKDYSALEQSLRLVNQGLALSDQVLLDEELELPIDIKQFINSYLKRNDFKKSSPYQANAEVTQSDIAKWLTALSANVQSENIQLQVNELNHQAINNQHASKLEQFVLHMSINSKDTTDDVEFANRFENLLRGSNLTLFGGKQSQISITLSPTNLGDMVVRLTEVNGEMIVKLLVTTAHAKTALESNMHQLKHMFSPHQIIVEKQDQLLGTVDQAPAEQDAHDENSETFEHDEKEFNSQKNEQSDEFEQTLQEILEEKE